MKILAHSDLDPGRLRAQYGKVVGTFARNRDSVWAALDELVVEPDPAADETPDASGRAQHARNVA